MTDADDLEFVKWLHILQADARVAERARRKHRQDIADAGVKIALVVVMIFLACFTVGGMLMVFGYSLLF